jgi:hypothetical protein
MVAVLACSHARRTAALRDGLAHGARQRTRDSTISRRFAV